MGYKFYILIVLLLFLSLGSVCASGDDYGIEPVNDSFADNDTEFIDEFPSSIDSGFDNDDFNFIKSGFGLSIAQLFFSGTYDYLFRNEANS